MKKILILLFIIFLAFSFYLYNVYNTKRLDKREPPLSVWAVYWDVEQVPNEIQSIKSSIGEISYFAAYFNKDNQLFIPKNIINLHSFLKNTLKNTDILHYLSIVNDKMQEDGSFSLKDKKLLYNLLVQEKNRKQHIANLTKICLEYGYDGIEIDYEGLKDDEYLWPHFLELCNSLWQSLDSHGLNMRVILEPSASIEKYDLPKGPTYVIMCYNLHGIHSGSGPKANREFLQMLTQKMKETTANVNYALATGGFDWDSKGNIMSITEEKAAELVKTYNTTPKRDEESHCLVFNYIDENHVRHEVWFADGDTLNYWIDILAAEGAETFSLWRLGGNKRESLIKIIDDRESL